MVVIRFPSDAATGVTQERTAAPSMWTVHAPHCAMPQPYLVPVSPTCSRITQSSGVSGVTLTSTDFPLIVKRTMAFLPKGPRGGTAIGITFHGPESPKGIKVCDHPLRRLFGHDKRATPPRHRLVR